jgi:hypothetical protein
MGAGLQRLARFAGDDFRRAIVQLLAPAGGQAGALLRHSCLLGRHERVHPSIGLPIGLDFLPVSHGATNAAASRLSEAAPPAPVAGDPHLHVLNFLMNVVATADGRDGAVRSIPTPRKLDDLRDVRWRRHSGQTREGQNRPCRKTTHTVRFRTPTRKS